LVLNDRFYAICIPVNFNPLSLTVQKLFRCPGTFSSLCIYKVYRKTSPTAYGKVDEIEMNIKVPFSDIRNNNRNINFCNCTNENTPREALQPLEV